MPPGGPSPAAQPFSPPGGIRLLDGFTGYATSVIGGGFKAGRIAGKHREPLKGDALLIWYQIGPQARDDIDAVKDISREWSFKQIISGQPVEVVKTWSGELYARFPKDNANFYAGVKEQQHVAEFLAIVLTYPDPPAKKD